MTEASEVSCARLECFFSIRNALGTRPVYHKVLVGARLNTNCYSLEGWKWFGPKLPLLRQDGATGFGPTWKSPAVV